MPRLGIRARLQQLAQLQPHLAHLVIGREEVLVEDSQDDLGLWVEQRRGARREDRRAQALQALDLCLGLERELLLPPARDTLEQPTVSEAQPRQQQRQESMPAVRARHAYDG